MLNSKFQPSLWALVDCNNFFASCERIFRPDLIGKPVVVLSSNDGCIVARSNEAKALGIGMGEPEFKVRELLIQHDVAVFSSNFALYGDISSRVMRTLESLVPEVEQYSVDEAFIPLHGALASNADEVALEMWKRIPKWTGIHVAVGLGTTRTLAKLASEKAKKGTGICRLDAGSPFTDQILAQTPVGDIWGIGKKSALKMRVSNIYYARDLRDADGAVVKKELGITGTHTALELRGIPCMSHLDSPAPRKSMVSSRSFGERVTDKQQLAEAVAMHCALVGERLRRENLEAGGMAVHIRTSRHSASAFYDQTAEITLPRPTSNTLELLRAASRGLDEIYRNGYAFSKAGIMLFDLSVPGSKPGNLLDWAKPETGKRPGKKLMSALDTVNRRYGRGTLRFAAEGKKESPWRVKSDRRSPRSTTSWDELPVVKC
jgi:DNA polymerase V